MTPELREKLEGAGGLLISCRSFIEAGRELDGEEPPRPSDVVFGYMGNGASIRFHWQDLVELTDALDELLREGEQ